jgi:hypothetical protein
VRTEKNMQAVDSWCAWRTLQTWLYLNAMILRHIRASLVYNAVFVSEETNNLVVVVSVEPLSSDEDAIYADQLITETDQETSVSNSAVDLVQGNTSDVPEVLTRKGLLVLDKTRPCIKMRVWSHDQGLQLTVIAYR